MSDLEFVISDGSAKSQQVPFPGPKFFVGSGPECQVRLQGLADKHAEVMLDAQGQPWVRDLSGQRQLWVNGQPTDKGPLPVGAFLKLGPLELVVRQRGRGGSGTMATPTPYRAPAAVKTATGARAGLGPSSARNPKASTGSQRSVPPEVALDATAKRPTPFAHPGAPPPGSLDNPDDGLEAPIESTVISSMLMPGSVIDGRYAIVGKLAAGGMGEVYKAEHVELGKTMAVKVMLPELSRDQEFVARFKREAVAASRIGQQNIVDISDFGRTENGRFYFVMEYLDGMTLASLVHREKALPVERVLNISLQACRALAAAHAQSIVHRDLKPENIMLLQRPGQPDFVKVLDFGVAKVSHGQGQGGHTAVGMVVGTPQYMSPEQAKAIVVDARSDIYSMGLIVYELVTGRPTFEAETPSMLMVKHVTEAPPPLAPGPLGGVPEELERIIFQMLEKDPANRPQTMELVVQQLEALWARVRSNDPSVRRVTGEHAPVSSTRVPAARTSGVGAAAAAVAQGPAAELDAPLAVKKSPLPFVIAGALVAGVLGAGAMVAFQKDPPPPPVVVVQPAPKPEPTPAPTPVPVPAPVPTASKVTLKFETQPAGAEVYEGDVLLGTTPAAVQRDGNAVVELTFKLKGYKPLTRRVGFSADQTLHIDLDKVGAKPRPRPRPDGLQDDPYGQTDDLKDLPE